MPASRLNTILIYAGSILFWVIFTCIAGYLQMSYTFELAPLKAGYFIVPGSLGLIFGFLAARIFLLSQRLKQSSIRDSLTQSFNHGYYMQTLKEWCDDKSIFSLVMIDADHFKKINDQYGHKVGDQVLVRMSELVNETKRSYDIFARHGGEEFVLLAPRTDLVAAFDLASRLREVIGSTPMPLDIHLTCSFGVAEYRQHSDTPDSLFERADQALYLSKSKGRNCVTREQPAAEAA